MMYQSKKPAAAESYVPPICEELPVWAEGPLCGSGFTETVNETEEEDW